MTTTTFTPSYVLNRICEHFSIVPGELSLIGSKEDTLFVVQAYIYCLYRFTGMTIKEISVHTCRTPPFIATALVNINQRCKVDADYRAKIIKVEEVFE